MSDLSVPFNISLLNLTPERLAGLKPVTSLDIVDMNRNFNENGLFSISIFGRIGDERRNRRFSYIDIKTPIFHPVIYRSLVQLKRFYGEILESKSYAVWDAEVKDFVKSDQLQGSTGFNFFMQHWKEIEFEERPSDTRMTNIEIIRKFKDIATLDKVIVLPAGMRDIQIEDGGRMSRDEINDLYLKLISVSNSIPTSAIEHSIQLLDGARLSMQRTFNQIYDMIENMIKGKKKLLMNKWASRKIYNGTRNVITSMNVQVNELGNEGNIGFNNTMVGLYQYMKAALPIAKFHLRSGFLSNVFTGPNDPVYLVDKKTLKKVAVKLKPVHHDSWMTDEGIEKVISLFGEESLRHKQLEIEGYYVGLIYKGPGVFKLFQDIDDLPEGLDKKYVQPVTFCELMYISVYHDSDKYPCFVTRYPVTGFGSIYVSYPYLKPTVKTEVRKPLDENWQVNENVKTAYNFPTLTDFVNSISPHPSKLARLTADFDGDTASFNVVYSDESIAEAAKFMQSKRYYVGTDDKISFSSETDTVKFVLHNLTSDVS